MKKYITLTIILILLSQVTLSQVKKEPDPVRDVNITQMDKFTGTWQGQLNNISFTLILKREELGPGLFFLVGWYNYKKNERTIVHNADDVDKLKDAGLTGFVKKGDDSVHFSFSDLSYNNNLRHGMLFFDRGNVNQLVFELSNERHKTTLTKRRASGLIIDDTISQDFRIVLKKIK